jgi:multiple sugar transport system substrate-binding protein
MDELAQCIKDCTIVDEGGKITQMGMIPNYPWLDATLFAKVFNAKFIDEDTNTITFNSPEMIKAFQWQQDIIDTYINDNINSFKDGLGARATAEDPLLTGKLAMRWGPETQITALEEYGKDVDWAVAPFPTEPENIGMSTCNVWEMNSKTADPEAAWTVLSSLTSSETMISLAEGEFNNGAFYARKSAVEWIRDKAEVSEKTKYVADYLLNSNLTPFPMLSYVNEYLNAISTEMEKVLIGGQTVEEAANAVTEQIQPLADANPYSK